MLSVYFLRLGTRDSQLSRVTKFYNHFGCCKDSISATVLENAATKGLITSSVASDVTAACQLLQASFQYMIKTFIIHAVFSSHFSPISSIFKRTKRNESA